MPTDSTPSHGTRLYSAVDRSDETYEPSPHASRRTIPSGRVSPDGKRAWPKPSLTSKIVIFGGMGIAAAAATAGAVLAVKALVDAIGGGDDDDDAVEAARQRARTRRSDRPRPSSYGSRPSSALGFTGGDRRRDDEDRPRRPREAPRRRPPAAQGSVVDSVNDTVSSVTTGVRDVLETVTAAIEGFRSVATQAGEVMSDFNRAADQVKSMLEPADRSRARTRSPSRPDAEIVDLREQEGAQDRTHRL